MDSKISSSLCTKFEGVVVIKEVCDSCWSRHGRNKKMFIDGPINIKDDKNPVELDNPKVWKRAVTSCPFDSMGWKFNGEGIPEKCPYEVEHFVSA